MLEPVLLNAAVRAVRRRRARLGQRQPRGSPLQLRALLVAERDLDCRRHRLTIRRRCYVSFNRSGGNLRRAALSSIDLVGLLEDLAGDLLVVAVDLPDALACTFVRSTASTSTPVSPASAHSASTSPNTAPSALS